MSTPMMQAIQVHHYGSPEVLKVESIPRPEPKANEILVRVHAAGVLPMETAVRGGMFPGVMPKAFPYIPGTAFSGVIEAVGSGVTDFQVGQAICGRSPSGTYAEYTTVLVNPPVAASKKLSANLSASVIPLAPKPDSLTFDEAAVLSGGATTAWTSIFDDGGLQAGQRAFIHGAAGGVGLFAVQFAKWKGAEVIATTSTANVDFVRSLGADVVVDYTTTPFEDAARDVDFVFDTIGGETLQRSMKILKRGGTLISVVEEPSQELAQSLGIRAVINDALPNSNHLRSIVDVIDQGYAKAYIRQVFSLDEAPLAHELCETGHGRGRIVLHIMD